MPQNAMAGIRGRLAARIIMIMAIPIVLGGGACASRDGEAPAAAGGQPPTLRETLSPAELSIVALLDSQTPFPSTEGQAALLVDGDYYATAAAAVRAHVQKQLEAGVPVVVFGNQTGYDALRSSVRAAADLPGGAPPGQDDDLPGRTDHQDLAVAARGLKLYPGGPGELAGSAAIEIAGPPDELAPLIGPMLRWAEDCARELQ